VLEQLAIHKKVPPIVSAGSIPLIEILAHGATAENETIADPTRLLLTTDAANLHAKIFPAVTFANGCGTAATWSDFEFALASPQVAAQKQHAKLLASPPATVRDRADIVRSVATSHFDLLAALSESSAKLDHIHTLLAIDVAYAGNIIESVGRAHAMQHSCPGGIRGMMKAASETVSATWRDLANLVVGQDTEPSLGYVAISCLELQTAIYAQCVRVYEVESGCSDAAIILGEKLALFEGDEIKGVFEEVLRTKREELPAVATPETSDVDE